MAVRRIKRPCFFYGYTKTVFNYLIENRMKWNYENVCNTKYKIEFDHTYARLVEWEFYVQEELQNIWQYIIFLVICSYTLFSVMSCCFGFWAMSNNLARLNHFPPLFCLVVPEVLSTSNKNYNSPSPRSNNVDSFWIREKSEWCGWAEILFSDFGPHEGHKDNVSFLSLHFFNRSNQ